MSLSFETKTPVSSRGKWLLVTIVFKTLINLNTDNSNGVEGPQNGGYQRICQVKFEAVYSIPTNQQSKHYDEARDIYGQIVIKAHDNSIY